MTVRNFFRTHRVTPAEVSCFADGSALGGQSAHWWALCVVLRDGKAITARGTTRSGRPSSKTLATITQAAERYQIPAELTGAVWSRGLYADPGGQRGARYWSGRDWSPLLPANLANGKPLPVFPARVSLPLPEPDGSWQYAASQAKRCIVRAAVYAAAAVLLLAGALIVDLWDHGKLHRHVGLFGWLVLAGLCAFGGLSAWLQRKGYRKLDHATSRVAGLAGAEQQQDALPGWLAGAEQQQDALPGQPPSDGRELDADGVPVQEQPAKDRIYLLGVIAPLICGVVSTGLEYMALAYPIIHNLPGWKGWLGPGAGFLAIATAFAALYRAQNKKLKLGVASRVIVWTGMILGGIGLFLYMVATNAPPSGY